MVYMATVNLKRKRPRSVTHAHGHQFSGLGDHEFHYTLLGQRLSCALTGTSAARVLRMIATDRMQAARIATGGKDAHIVPRVYGRVGYDVPMAQSATFRLKQYDTASDDDDASVVDEANAYAEGSVFRSQAGAGSAVDDPGGGIDDPGGGDTDDLGSLDNLATSTTTSSKTSVSFVSSSLTTGFYLLSLSD